MQPAYFPWVGYFRLIDRVDAFVFLDDAQYEKGSWQNRNRVLVDGKPHWLTVPAARELLGQPIHEVALDEKRNWRQKHFRLLSQAYARHPHAAAMIEVAALILDPALRTLAELDIRIITAMAAALGVQARLLRSSELGIDGARSARLIAICERLGCDEYLSPPGSAAYLAEDDFTGSTAIRLAFNEFTPTQYPQQHAGEFVSHLSLLDVVANLGWRAAADYMRAG